MVPIEFQSGSAYMKHTIATLDFPAFSYVLEQVSDVRLSEKKLDYLSNSKSEIRNVCNAVEGHCLQAMKIVHYHANGRFDLLISEHQSVNPSLEAISILPEKYKGFTFVHNVCGLVGLTSLISILA